MSALRAVDVEELEILRGHIEPERVTMEALMAAAAPPSPDELLEPGSVLDGRYRIDGAIGGGGMARVYRAEHLGIGRAVAIKVLHASLSRSREAVLRFQREAVTSGRLDHPNIVTVTDSGMLHDGRCYIVMEALDGETLGDKLAREGRIPWRAALALARGIVVGLHHAHEHGVIHRDIKPDNIFVLRRDQEPLIKILDFGIARLSAGSVGESRITQQGLTIGSPAYMSPEQAVDGEITPASDLYSFTVVLFEMLTGHTPFDRGDPVATMKAHISTPAPALREVAPNLDLPDGLEEVVRLGLAKIAAERVGSADQMLAMLDAFLHGARPDVPRAAAATATPSLPDRVQRGEPTIVVRPRPGRRPWILAGATMLAVVAIASYVVVRSATTDATGAREREQERAPAPGSPADRGAPPVGAPPRDDVEEIDLEEIDMTPHAEPGAGSGSARGPAPRDRPRNRNDAKPWIAKGKQAMAAGRFDEARSSFERAVAIDRGAHAAFAGLAEVAHNRADFSGAVLAAKRAVALAPRSAAYRLTLARAYYKIMRYDDAIQQWQKVLELDPKNASAKTNIEMAKSKLGR